MGGLCSTEAKPNPYADRSIGHEKQYHHHRQQQQVQMVPSKIVMAPPTGQDTVEKEVEVKVESPKLLVTKYEDASDDDFYDGIPRYRRSSQRSRSLRTRKISEVSSLIGRASSFGRDRTAEVLNNLNLSGLVFSANSKTSELSILAFEVANTVVKGSSLMQSLSKRSMRQLKEVVLPAEGVQQLISEDVDELLRIVADDKRDELRVFAAEVVRFGNRCKDPQWHNLDRFFQKRSRDRTPQKQLREAAESVMEQLMSLVQLTAELYQELSTLDRLEEDYQHKRLEVLRFNSIQTGDRDGTLSNLDKELKSQKKLVKSLKKKSLWSRSLEEVMEKLVDIVLFLNHEINNAFGNPDHETPETKTLTNQQKLGPAGLALHYANIILQIDSIAARTSPVPQNVRDTLYQSLPPSIKSSLKFRLQSFYVEKELTVDEIKDEMEKTLQWLVPIATNTAKAYHGFGWVGEWASTGSELNRRSVGTIDVMQIETLHHADKQKTETYILDLLLWLNYLVSRFKVRPSVKSPACSPLKEADQKPITEVAKNELSIAISQDQHSSLVESKTRVEAEK